MKIPNIRNRRHNHANRNNQGFSGSWGSGLGHLIIEDLETGNMDFVPCDNGPTVRALESAFGNVIGDGHRVDENGGHVGQLIQWDWDDLGLMLGWFLPFEDIENGRLIAGGNIL